MLILLPVYGLAPGHTHRVGRIPKITHPRSPEAAADFLKLRPTHTTISSKDPLPVLLMTAFFTMLAPVAALAVSGGGLDYAGTDISGKDFSNGNYKGKDFTQGTYCPPKNFKNLHLFANNQIFMILSPFLSHLYHIIFMCFF